MALFRKKTGFWGDYDNWQEALSDCSGYDQSNILEKVKESLLLVREGKAVFERDSVAFSEFDCSWPILAMLLKAYAEADSSMLNVVDFGGSLGSSYFNFKPMFPVGLKCCWNVIEQSNFVEEGRVTFEDEHLKFYLNVDELPSTKVDVLLLASVLTYLEKPLDVLDELMGVGARYLLIDRTLCFPDCSRITKQVVPDSIYKASYPAWILNREKLFGVLERRYEIVAVFNSLRGKVRVGRQKAREIGVICRLKD